MAHRLNCPSLYREERPFTFSGREKREDDPLKIVREKIVFDHVKKRKEDVIAAECSRLTGEDHHKLIKYPSLPRLPPNCPCQPFNSCFRRPCREGAKEEGDEVAVGVPQKQKGV